MNTELPFWDVQCTCKEWGDVSYITATELYAYISTTQTQTTVYVHVHVMYMYDVYVMFVGSRE